MFLLPVVLPPNVNDVMLAVVDSSLLTLISAPVLWWVIIGPLNLLAKAERSRAFSIIEAAADGIITTDEQGKIESFNTAAEQMFGYTHDEVIGQGVSRLICLPDSERQEEPVVSLFRKLTHSTTRSGQELEARRKDTTAFPMWLAVSEVSILGKRVYTAIVRDLTEQKRIELQKRERDIARAEQMAVVAQLATGVAHELRNPLTSIKLLVQNGREELTTQGVPDDDLDIIEKEILRMERSLEAFLQFARPSKLVSRQFSMVELVDQVFLLVEGRAFQQSVVCIKTGISSAELLVVNSDLDKIQQVLLNLVLNALDAMPKGGTLEINLAKTDDRQLEIWVIDSGPGVSLKVMPRLFTGFVTTKETGVGIGLLISRRLIEECRGSLSAHNRSEGGACFVLRLPV